MVYYYVWFTYPGFLTYKIKYMDIDRNTVILFILP